MKMHVYLEQVGIFSVFATDKYIDSMVEIQILLVKLIQHSKFGTPTRFR